MNVEWEQAAPDEWPIVYYRCYDSSLALFKTRQKVSKKQNDDMFGEVEPENADGEIATGERRDYRMRLPYTSIMIERYNQRKAFDNIVNAML